MANLSGNFRISNRILAIASFIVVGCASVRADQTIVIRSGNGSVGSQDSTIHVLPFGTTGNITPTPANFVNAQSAPGAFVVNPYATYIPTVPSDPTAKWIAVNTGLPQGSALFAVPFQVTDSSITSAALDFHFSVDNAVNGVYFNGTRISGNSLDGDYHAEYRFVRNDIAPLLIPNSTNWLYVNMADYGALAALIFNVTITVTGGGSQPISPTQGGNTGGVSVKISGQDFPQTGVSVILRGPGQPDIVGLTPVVISSNEIDTVFNLRGAPAGVRDVIVTSASVPTLTLPSAFTVVTGGGPQLSVDVLGPSRVRTGREATFNIVVTNTGSVDAEFTQVQVSQQSVAASMASAEGDLRAFAIQPFAIGGLVCSGFDNLTGLRIPTGGSRTLTGTCTTNGDSCSALTPTVTQDHREDDDPCEEERQRVADLQQELTELNFELRLLESAYLVQQALSQVFGCDNVTALNAAICALLENEKLRLLRRRSDVRALIEVVQDELILAQAELVACEAVHGLNRNSLTGPNMTLTTQAQSPSPLAAAGTAPVSPPASGSLTVCGVTSVDPNSKTGVSGSGPQHLIKGDTPLIYTVDFENLPTAGAAADTVTVTDPLSNSLDVSTADVRAITFGNTSLQLPPGTQQYSTVVDLRPGQNALVKVNLEITNNVLSLTLSAVDPVTGQPPSDPSIGVLLPNQVPPQGEGSLTFTIHAKAGLPTGTQIQNQATIVFDDNAPIATPVWSNFVDNTPPVSTVSPLGATQSSGSFRVQWQATDSGAGIQGVTIFVSNNNGPFVPWIVNASGTESVFSGQPGHTYSFYSEAQDAVGNNEALKNAAETITTVQGGVVGDVNGDSKVDCADIAIVRAAFGARAGDLKYDARADVNGDGLVDIRDLATVAQRLTLGTVCP